MNSIRLLKDLISENEKNVEYYENEILSELKNNKNFEIVERHAREARFCQERILEFKKQILEL